MNWLKSKLTSLCQSLIYKPCSALYKKLKPSLDSLEAWWIKFKKAYNIDQKWFMFKYFLIGKYHCNASKKEKVVWWVLHKILWLNIIAGLSIIVMKWLPWLLNKLILLLFWALNLVIEALKQLFSLVGILF